jgi:hypothetical protein
LGGSFPIVSGFRWKISVGNLGYGRIISGSGEDFRHREEELPEIRKLSVMLEVFPGFSGSGSRIRQDLNSPINPITLLESESSFEIVTRLVGIGKEPFLASSHPWSMGERLSLTSLPSSLVEDETAIGGLKTSFLADGIG